ncbi:MAG: class II aldolase/adducin family protein [Clostridiaceae bacterium]|jgi:L-ribulose-5-phosphate 4-epimerase|nr:class II aldolase/adducin family protein [Clostridiaceae bacterium]
MMDIQKIKTDASPDETAVRRRLISLAHDFLKEGLVVRTWGNFSASLGDDTFIITPSGRSYHDLEPDELVKCSIATGKKLESELGTPSSEAPMHAIVYRKRPEYKVLAHTHQVYASALSLASSPIVLNDIFRERLGTSVIAISPYGLPGTKRLHRHMEESVQNLDAPFILMERHGAFLFGKNDDDCLTRARTLETCARALYEERVGRRDTPRASVHDDTAEEKAAASVIRSIDQMAVSVSRDPELQHLLDRPMGAYLDDFAQICGVKIRCEPGKNNVFFMPEKRQAVCFADTIAEAQNVRAVLEKNTRACHIALLERKKPLAFWESRLMRYIYQNKYSKKAQREE